MLITMVHMMVHSMVRIVVNVTVHATVRVMINAMINVVVVVVLRLMRGLCDGCAVADLIAGALIWFQIGVLFALFQCRYLDFLTKFYSCDRLHLIYQPFMLPLVVLPMP